MNEKIKEIIGAIIMLIIGVGCGIGVHIIATSEGEGEVEVETEVEVQNSIELAEEQIPALIETTDGGIEIANLPTVIAVDSGNLTGLVECPEGETECGLGVYIWAPTATPQEFAEYTLGKCFNTDGAYDEQCWDYADLFVQNYAGRRLSTCGTGSAKGTWEGDCKYINAGNEFDLVFPEQVTTLQYGDLAVFDNGIWGHIGTVVGVYNNGFIALQGQNQGGGLCPGSSMGGKVNIINISLEHFAGAFRPKTYVKTEPAPTAEELPDSSH